MAYWESLVAKSHELGLIHTRPPSMGGALAPKVASAHCAHMFGRWPGETSLDLCGVLMRESIATRLAEARWGAYPGL